MSLAVIASSPSSPSSQPNLLMQFKHYLSIATVPPSFQSKPVAKTPLRSFFWEKEIVPGLECTYLSHTRPNLCPDFLM